MIFKISSQDSSKFTYCGVLEFTAPEGIVYLPNWILSILGVSSGDLCKIERVDTDAVPTGKFIKIQPQSVEFLGLTDPKGVLENGLRNYNTLSPGDIFTIASDGFSGEECLSFEVLEALPGNSVIKINDTDLEVDFAPPVGWEEPSTSTQPYLARSILGVKKLADFKVQGCTTEPYPVILPKNILFLGCRAQVATSQ
ncbi:hypothetical protein DI09_12p260 [Mitosporidium daphniae]|uniref:Ubiquitin fusion degradation protein n=1 Tax=Mitosporidium daphniae TaxID=1485682 RepID=A0A098VUV4_9MICR|nr:uncharacterized protein DI09_12p260 [Mitosporidium daphniae]KGG52858.1 hypothetical protein DI09_12p260 [Mitosporidium daphniae]|eukprot:XP_013239285.1 uncharacterized protein DI09_12p260 [Mitosporidium daphniae]